MPVSRQWNCASTLRTPTLIQTQTAMGRGMFGEATSLWGRCAQQPISEASICTVEPQDEVFSKIELSSVAFQMGKKEKKRNRLFPFEIKSPTFQTRSPSRGRHMLKLRVIIVVLGREKGMEADVQHFPSAYSSCLRTWCWVPWQHCIGPLHSPLTLLNPSLS